jgi:hypothetical protein
MMMKLTAVQELLPDKCYEEFLQCPWAVSCYLILDVIYSFKIITKLKDNYFLAAVNK